MRLAFASAVVVFACARSAPAVDRVSVTTPAPVARVATPPIVPAAAPAPHVLTDDEIAERAQHDPAALGPLSIGKPNRGVLVNAVAMPEDPKWHVVDRDNSYGTPETMESIAGAVTKVNAAYPDTVPLYIGQISAREGGRLRPHKSHQAGRDADIGYYYKKGEVWYARANAKNLDLPRTWELTKAFAADPNVEAIFMDASVQFLLKKHALKAGEDPKFVDTLFAKNRRDWSRLVHHEHGHLTHMHVRFKSEASTEAGFRAHAQLLALGRIPARRYY